MSFKTPRGYPNREERDRDIRAGRLARLWFAFVASLAVCCIGTLILLVFAVIGWLGRH